MNPNATTLALALLALILAGCTGAHRNGGPLAGDASLGSTLPASPGTRVVPLAADRNHTALPPHTTIRLNGTYPAWVAHTAGSAPQSDHVRIQQDRPFANLTAVLTWTSPGGLQDLDVAVTAPGAYAKYPTAQAVDTAGWFYNRGGAPGGPDSPSRLHLDRDTLGKASGCGPPSVCEWVVWALTKGGAAAVEFQLRVDIDYADDVTDS